MSLAFQSKSVLEQEYATKASCIMACISHTTGCPRLFVKGDLLFILLTTKYNSKSRKSSPYFSQRVILIKAD
jgi:hypothetical protein